MEKLDTLSICEHISIMYRIYFRPKVRYVGHINICRYVRIYLDVHCGYILNRHADYRYYRY